MFSLIKNSLRLKIILLLVAVLVVSFGVLSATIVNVQNFLLVSMTGKVDTKLINTGENMQEQFLTLQSNVTNALFDMGEKAADTIHHFRFLFSLPVTRLPK